MSLKPAIICLMGPTASGKTPMAVELVQQLPCKIISVDSAMIYRGMDIGTAKPSKEILQIAPHRLIDIVDPAARYSAGQFRKDALNEIEDIIAMERVPLLVGGTMMYFRILQQGIANLPPADLALREALKVRAAQVGWEVLHNELAQIDPEAAKRIQPRDCQRIQRALEVYQLTGKTISAWQQRETNPLPGFRIINIALAPAERDQLHQRIERRFLQMLEDGLVDEVRKFYNRGNLSPDLPSMRCVGYRQVWEYLAGQTKENEMQERAIAATRQLAKRQLTWLRSWPNVKWFDTSARTVWKEVKQYIVQSIND